MCKFNSRIHFMNLGGISLFLKKLFSITLVKKVANVGCHSPSGSDSRMVGEFSRLESPIKA